MMYLRTTPLLIFLLVLSIEAFLLRPALTSRSSIAPYQLPTCRPAFFVIQLDKDDDEEEEEDDDDEEEEEPDPYRDVASSEFADQSDQSSSSSRSLVLTDASGTPTTTVDWGGALGKLRERMEDVETGKSGDPSHALFRLMSSQSPNQAIGKFISSASPQVVQAMSGAVSSLLGGLSNPMTGVETVVKASGDKVASLCFQLQMTGYLFRNAEYVLALKDLMKLKGSASLDDYKEAFDRLDQDNSGFIEASKVESLLDDVYDGKTPGFEVQAFLSFFDKNQDGKISWDEFVRGLVGMVENIREERQSKVFNNLLLQPADDDSEDSVDLEASLSGTLEIELEDGKIVEVDAQEYMDALKQEAKALKEALQIEKGAKPRKDGGGILPPMANGPTDDELGGIASYIASRQGDVKALTEGISPEIVQTMKMLVDFVLEGGDSKKAKGVKKEEMEMEIPGTALQQLALWQLVLGYRLREAEAKGEYLRLLE